MSHLITKIADQPMVLPGGLKDKCLLCRHFCRAADLFICVKDSGFDCATGSADLFEPRPKNFTIVGGTDVDVD